MAKATEEHPLLRLQQTAGNMAVQRLVQLQRDRAADEDRTARLAWATSGGDWTGAATILLHSDEKWMIRQLRNMRAEELLRLDDAVRRMHVLNSRLRIFIHAGLMQLGATPDSAAPGAAYGEIEGKATPKNGKLNPGQDNDPASYFFEVTFMPNPAAVDAELIEFVQVAKVVSTVHSTPDSVGEQVPDNEGANGRDRQTTGHSRVDRVGGMDQPWIGEKDSGRPLSGRLRPWHPGSSSPAYMNDTPSRHEPNITFDFETAAVCRKGNDLGKVYATVQWGFTIDANMQVVPKDTVYFNKESSEFDLAVAFWNAESDRADSTQKHLPTIR